MHLDLTACCDAENIAGVEGKGSAERERERGKQQKTRMRKKLTKEGGEVPYLQDYRILSLSGN